jgi:LPXTG-motif cell wall-anchored protein
MSSNENNEKHPTTSGIFAGYFVIVLHILLILGLALVVIFLQGVNEYLNWILFGGICLILGSGYLFYRKIKNDNKKLRDILNDPAFQGKSLEISFLGGMASLKVAQSPSSQNSLGQGDHTPAPQLEDSHSIQVRELTQIAHLLENDLISQEEYERLKKAVLNQHQNTS